MSLNLKKVNACILIPTYNNEKTLTRVLDSVLLYGNKNEIYVVNDGATDSTSDILLKYDEKLTILTNDVNKGKGFSIKKGVKQALKDGFDYMITMDSDGQHFADDIPKIINEIEKFPGNVIMGSRNMNQESVPGKSSFGNKFSNFWFYAETGIKLPDTQTGFRAYPLKPLKGIKLFTNKFELEIEIIVRLAWKNIKFSPVEIKVLYDANERVSHFRPGRDFFRISVLNSILILFALLVYYPKKILSKETLLKIKAETIKKNESSFKKSLSLGFGVFMGIFPIWGFQLLIGIPLAVFFKLNKVLFITAANISLPPMIPFIIYFSYFLGGFFSKTKVNLTSFSNISLKTIHLNFVQYFIGAIALSIFAFLCVFSLSYFIFKLFRKNNFVNDFNK